MKTIAQSADRTPGDKGTQYLQVVLPTPLARRAKAAAAENGWKLKELVQKALEQYLGMERAA